MKKKFLFFISVFLLSTCATNNGFRAPSSVFNCQDLISEILEANFVSAKRNFSELLEDSYKAGDIRKIENNLDALLFVDYNHSIEELYKLYNLQNSLSSASIRELYNSGEFGFSNRAFSNYLDASEYLQTETPKFNLETLKKIHAKMMRGGIDGIPADAIGKPRVVSIFGTAEGELAVDEDSYQELLKNVYIDVRRLTKKSDGKYYGYISYSNVDQMRPELLAKIKKIDVKLHDDIVKFQTQGTGSLEELTERMVNALVEDLLDWFVKQKNQIGEINSNSKFKAYTKLVAKFQKDLISIHPFRDGNGRSIRQFALYYPFWIEDLPAPRLIDVNSDIFLSDEEWASRIADGVRNSLELYKSMSARIKSGFPVESTPELFAPDLPHKIKIAYKKKTGVVSNYKDEVVDPGQFAKFYAIALTKEEYARDFTQNTDAVYKRITEKFEDFYKRSHMFYDHDKNGKEYLELNFVDNDFIASFANQSFKNKKMYEDKMSRWYSPETIWRGLSRSDKEIKEEEIIGMFSQVHHQFVSNAVSGQMRPRMSDAQLRKVIFNDFNRYNQDLFDETMVEMAKDHSESGPKYGISYGYSTSKNRTVGKAFAMGAMVIAPYGKHQEMQHLLKSRVLVGMKRAKKDVDLTRLKQLRNNFSYKYGRQQEVMGIGAADPDSVDFVQLIDHKGDVIKSYVRNPKNPAQILVFDQEVSSLDELPLRPIEKIDL